MKWLGTMLWLLGGFVGGARAADTKPNILLIVADDMGYSDPGCFGGEIATPALDRLATDGVRLTHFYNGGMCVISRASLLTGQWWPKALPHFAKTPLLSEMLRAAGYRTGLIGKWHLPGDPMDRGFDHYFGFLNGFADHFAGSASYRLDRETFRAFRDNYYSSDAFTDRAIAFIHSSAPDKSERPFFLYLSYQAPHNPLQAPKADVLKHRGKYLRGWQAVREARFERQNKMGIVPGGAALPEYPQNLPEWNSLTPEQRDLEDLRMATYAAMVERMDTGIGRVVKALAEAGKADNTLVIFMSDNGADSFSSADESMLKAGKLPGDQASNWQPGTGWAYASVTPWRHYKISQHSGGVASGTIVRWPRGIAAPGRIEHSLIHMADVLPTLLEVTALSPRAATTAGESFLPLLRGSAWNRTGSLFFQFADNRAIRTTEWTMAEVDGAGWELFRIGSDPLETTDVAGKHPDTVADLERRWSQWWRTESGKPAYLPESTRDSSHYAPQGDRGTGQPYHPSAMPAALADRYPLP